MNMSMRMSLIPIHVTIRIIENAIYILYCIMYTNK